MPSDTSKLSQLSTSHITVPEWVSLDPLNLHHSYADQSPGTTAAMRLRLSNPSLTTSLSLILFPTSGILFIAYIWALYTRPSTTSPSIYNGFDYDSALESPGGANKGGDGLYGVKKEVVYYIGA
jgi:hypothetical protein